MNEAQKQRHALFGASDPQNYGRLPLTSSILDVASYNDVGLQKLQEYSFICCVFNLETLRLFMTSARRCPFRPQCHASLSSSVLSLKYFSFYHLGMFHRLIQSNSRTSRTKNDKTVFKNLETTKNYIIFLNKQSRLVCSQ